MGEDGNRQGAKDAKESKGMQFHLILRTTQKYSYLSHFPGVLGGSRLLPSAKSLPTSVRPQPDRVHGDEPRRAPGGVQAAERPRDERQADPQRQQPGRD